MAGQHIIRTANEGAPTFIMPSPGISPDPEPLKRIAPAILFFSFTAELLIGSDVSIPTAAFPPNTAVIEKPDRNAIRLFAF